MAKQLFLYTKPFVIADNPTNRQDHILDFFSENDRVDQDKIHATLLQFAVEHGVVINNDGTLITTPQTNTGSWIWMVTWLSFRAMIDYDQYQMVIASLQAGENDPLNLIIDLHSRLGTLFDHKLLNTLVHRTITTIEIIPFKTNDPEKEMSWENIHREAPFLWLMIFLQAVIRTSVGLPKA